MAWIIDRMSAKELDQYSFSKNDRLVSSDRAVDWAK